MGRSDPRAGMAAACWAAALLAGAVSPGPGHSAAAAARGAAGDPTAEILAIEREMEAVYNSPEFTKSPSVVHKYFAPDTSLVDIMEPGRFQGMAVLTHVDEIAATFQGKVTFQNTRVHATGDMGYVDYIQKFVGADANHRSVSMTLYTTDIFRKIDGKWLIVHEHVALPMDPETLAKVMAPKPR